MGKLHLKYRVSFWQQDRFYLTPKGEWVLIAQSEWLVVALWKMWRARGKGEDKMSVKLEIE